MKSYLRSISAYDRDIKLFFVYNLLSNIGIGVFMLLYNLYLIQLGFDESFIGEFQSISTIAMAGIALSIGILVNRFGVWQTVTVGVAFFIITSILACVVTDKNLLRIIAALSGAGNAFLFVPTMPFIVELTRRDERHGVAAVAFSLQSLSMTVGSLIGGYGARLLAFSFGFEVGSAVAFRATLIAGLLLAGLAIVPLLLMSEQLRAARPDDLKDLRDSPTPKTFDNRKVRQHMVVFVAIGGLMSLGAGAVFPFYNVFLKSIGATAGQIGIIYAIAGLTAAGIGLASPWAARRLGSLRAVALIRLAPVPVYLLLMATPWMPIAIMAHVVRTTSINMAWPIDSTYISEILPARARAAVFSYRSGAWNLGWALSAFIAGRAIVQYGYDFAFAAYVVFMTAAMVLFYVYFARSAESETSVAEPQGVVAASK